MLGVEPTDSERMDDIDENDVDEFDERQARSKPKKQMQQPAQYLPEYRGGGPDLH